MKILWVPPKGSFPDTTPDLLRNPQLMFPTLVGLTPSEHTGLMMEEEFDLLPLDEHWDVLGAPR
jgi:hypothetical protein